MSDYSSVLRSPCGGTRCTVHGVRTEVMAGLLASRHFLGGRVGERPRERHHNTPQFARVCV